MVQTSPAIASKVIGMSCQSGRVPASLRSSLILTAHANRMKGVMSAWVGDTVERHGRLDVMVCNSIGPKTAPFDEMTDALWREALDVKVVAQIRIAREAFKAMQSQRSGCILFMAGTHGRQ